MCVVGTNAKGVESSRPAGIVTPLGFRQTFRLAQASALVLQVLRLRGVNVTWKIKVVARRDRRLSPPHCAGRSRGFLPRPY